MDSSTAWQHIDADRSWSADLPEVLPSEGWEHPSLCTWVPRNTVQRRGGTMTTIHVPAGEGQHYPMIDGDHVAKVSVRDACGAFEVFEVVAPAGPMAPPHVSPWTGVLFLLEGRITSLVDGTPYDVQPGGLVVVPAGVPATFEVTAESARFLAVTTGDGAGRFFGDFSRSVPADRPAEVSMEAILSVTTRHGVHLAGT